MFRKKLLVLSVLVVAAIITGFGLTSWNDKTTVSDYISAGGPVNNIDKSTYNQNSNTDVPVWSLGAPMPAPTRYHGAGVTFQRNDTNWLFCMGGDENGSGGNSSVVSIYNATTNTWSTGAPMPTTLVFYTSATRLGTTIYVVGGIGPGGAFTSMVNEVKRYSITTNTWLTNAANYPTTVADGKAAGYQDSLIYVVGGLTNGTSTATANVNVYNAISNTWRAATSLPAARSGGAMAIIGDTIVYVCGGTGYNVGLSNTVYRGVISQSDRSVITWTTGAVYPGTSLHRMDAAPWGCQGIIVGPGSASGFTTTTAVYRYSPGLNAWTPLPPVSTTTSAAFVGSAWRTGNIYRFFVTSGLVLTPPYSIPQNQIMVDTLCPPPPGPPGQQTSYCRGGLNIPILDHQWARDSVQVVLGSACTVLDVNVRIDTVLHTWDSDLRFYLNKGATGVQIINSVGGSGDNFIGTVLDDSASIPIASGTAPFTGNFRPSNPLTPFNGGSTDGYWRLSISDTAGGDTGSLRRWCVIITWQCPVGGVHTTEIPNYYSLSQNYPNPFNPSTTIKYTLPVSENVKLSVYDITGREVAVLVNEYKTSGIYEVNFDASKLASGVYFYKIQAGEFTATKKMLLVK
jgi:hypothetical protein